MAATLLVPVRGREFPSGELQSGRHRDDFDGMNSRMSRMKHELADGFPIRGDPWLSAGPRVVAAVLWGAIRHQNQYRRHLKLIQRVDPFDERRPVSSFRSRACGPLVAEGDGESMIAQDSDRVGDRWANFDFAAWVMKKSSR